jgi:hypothetical protein
LPFRFASGVSIVPTRSGVDVSYAIGQGMELGRGDKDVSRKPEVFTERERERERELPKARNG